MSELVASSALLEAFAREVKEYWPPERELLASILEVLHQLLIVTLKAHNAKRLPEPIRVPRPASFEKASGPVPISMSEYAREQTQKTR